jgi:hypothetical protein
MGSPEIIISGMCPSCSFMHENTVTKIYRESSSRTRYAQCAKCKNIVPYKIKGCTCNEIKHRIIIGDCEIHQFLKEKGRQS